MSKLDADDFDDFFHALYGYAPFPWQSMLFKRLLEGSRDWPNLVDLPTASGKTACIDVAVFALAAGVPTPRRTWFVVDRRIVVDEAYERARRLALALRHALGPGEAMTGDPVMVDALRSVAEPGAKILRTVATALRELGGSRATPLEVARLRGGVPRDVAWAGNPAQPAVLTTTIDQIGSRLLFRGYGVGPHTQPVHAALAANDSLIILDEAHLARPFLQTVHAVQRFRKTPWAAEPIGTPFKLVVMSATPPAGMEQATRFPTSDERAAALNHERLQRRMSARKPTLLAIAGKYKPAKDAPDVGKPVCSDELVLDAAARAAGFAAADRRRVAVMVNRVRTARRVVEQLKASGYDADVQLLTGRLRPLDRDELIGRLTPLLRSGSSVTPERPMILVTTQCLEVGADFSFDALICECASLDALRQRFGRLARLGDPADASGVILIRKSDLKFDEKLDDEKPADPIYGNALARTWNWLTADGATAIDMGVDALAPRIAALEASGTMARLLGPTLRAPTLLPAYLDLWSQTTQPRPAVEPDVALFLHGVPPPDYRPRADVRVLWRDDLMLAAEADWNELLINLPPLSGEMVQLPLWELRGALAGTADDQGSDADLEGVIEPVPESSRRAAKPSVSASPFLIWRGANDCFLSTSLNQLKAGDVIILPADSNLFATILPGACLPPDVYEPAYRVKFGVIRRLERTFTVRGQSPGEFDRDAVLARLDDATPEADQPLFRSPQPIKYGPGFFHITGRWRDVPLDLWESDDDEDAASYAGEALPLDVHTKQVGEAVAEINRRLNIPAAFRDQLCRAADLHDVGKADQRFQFLLRHGRRGEGRPLLAKSKYRLSRSDEHKLYALAEIPEGFRHELLSMQMATLGTADQSDEARALLLHLIGSHHGQCRPFARVVIDEKPQAVTCPLPSGRALTIDPAERGSAPPHRLDSGVADRFWHLTRRHGWWGLAYLESILRCADMHASAFAEKAGER